jgi:anti-anti-sigma regulatory factor
MADITITERQAGDVTILDLDGKVTIGEGSVALRGAIRRVLGEGKTKLLLNLGHVGYIDSSGIGELGIELYCGEQRGRHAQALESDRKDPGSAGHHQVVDRFRRL